jgi:hypothetical protein
MNWRGIFRGVQMRKCSGVHVDLFVGGELKVIGLTVTSNISAMLLEHLNT